MVSTISFGTGLTNGKHPRGLSAAAQANLLDEFVIAILIHLI